MIEVGKKFNPIREAWDGSVTGNEVVTITKIIGDIAYYTPSVLVGGEKEQPWYTKQDSWLDWFVPVKEKAEVGRKYRTNDKGTWGSGFVGREVTVTEVNDNAVFYTPSVLIPENITEQRWPTDIDPWFDSFEAVPVAEELIVEGLVVPNSSVSKEGNWSFATGGIVETKVGAEGMVSEEKLIRAGDWLGLSSEVEKVIKLAKDLV